jgi:hypothetical protein
MPSPFFFIQPIVEVHLPHIQYVQNKRERGAERRIIFERCFREYVRPGICRASFKSVWGIREEMERGKRDKTFFSALQCAHTFTNCLLTQFEKIVGPLQK